METFESIRLNLEGMGRLGDAYGHHGNDLVYAFGGIPGEEVIVEALSRRKNQVSSRVTEVLKASPHRIDTPCPYVGACTGCDWQHISYKHQLVLKHQAVENEIRSIPELLTATIQPTIPSPQIFNYRNHARFSVWSKGAVGYVNRMTRRFISVDQCLLMDDGINRTLNELQNKCGETTQLSIRYGTNSGKWLVQPTLHDRDIPLKTGQTHYEETLLGHSFRIAASSFFQVNTRQAERIVSLVGERLKLSGSELLIDAYAGVGTFAVLLSPYARKVLAIEESASAVKDAEINSLGVDNLQFCEGRTEDVLANIEETPEAVILDPPRAGCHPKALEAVIALAASRVVYVSCDPRTMARDLGVLCRGRYKLHDVQPIDMFPQTHHVECVATLSLVE